MLEWSQSVLSPPCTDQFASSAGRYGKYGKYTHNKLSRVSSRKLPFLGCRPSITCYLLLVTYYLLLTTLKRASRTCTHLLDRGSPHLQKLLPCHVDFFLLGAIGYKPADSIRTRARLLLHIISVMITYNLGYYYI